MQVSEAEVESARREWEEGYRRCSSRRASRRPRERLHAQVDAVAGRASRRVGGVFTSGARGGVRRGRAVGPRGGGRARAGAGLAADAAVVEAAAFHLYARGAQDYEP